MLDFPGDNPTDGYREGLRLIMEKDRRSQSDKFKALARELEADEDEARWDERLKKVVEQKPQADAGPSSGDSLPDGSKEL